jgi:hypothetical protein
MGNFVKNYDHKLYGRISENRNILNNPIDPKWLPTLSEMT